MQLPPHIWNLIDGDQDLNLSCPCGRVFSRSTESGFDLRHLGVGLDRECASCDAEEGAHTHVFHTRLVIRLAMNCDGCGNVCTLELDRTMGTTPLDALSLGERIVFLRTAADLMGVPHAVVLGIPPKAKPQSHSEGEDVMRVTPAIFGGDPITGSA